MVRPLDFEKLDRLLTCAAFSLVENADRMLLIGEGLAAIRALHDPQLGLDP